MGGKNNEIRIKVSVEEKKKIESKAKETGMNTSSFLRFLALNNSLNFKISKDNEQKIKEKNKLQTIFHEISVKKKINAEEFAEDYFKLFGFEECMKFSKCKGHINKKWYNNLINDPIGRPDLIALKGDDVPVLIEVKTNGDGLRQTQFEWINKHPEFHIIVFYLKQNIIN